MYAHISQVPIKMIFWLQLTENAASHWLKLSHLLNTSKDSAYFLLCVLDI